MHESVLLGFVAASVLLTLSPGPDIIFVISQSLLKGKKVGYAISLGLTTGIFFHTTLVALGISQLLKTHQAAFESLKILGAIYLCYLAFQQLKSKPLGERPIFNPEKTFRKNFGKGLLMNLLNPKVGLFFVAFFPGFLFHDNWSTASQFWLLGLLFWLQATLIFLTVSYFSSSLSPRFQNHQSKRLNYFQAFLFLIIAVWLLI